MSTRVSDGLSRAGFVTVEQVAGTTKRDLHALPNMGEKSLRELGDAMAALGFRLHEGGE